MRELFMGFTYNPIVPIPVMAVFCAVLIIFKRRGVIPYIRQILTVLLLFVINLRPMYPSDNILVQKEQMELNVVFVVDDTISMIGDDQDGYATRLDRAKADMAYIMQNLPGSKFCVICFNNNAHVLTPFTDNIDYVQNAIDVIYPLSPTYATGTNISVCYDAVEEILERTEDMENTNTALFFLTDGENTDGGEMMPFDDLAEYICGGAVMGYGTDRGGHMSYYDSLEDEYETLMDYSNYPNNQAVTKIDAENLQALASDLGIPYLYMNSENVLEPVVDNLRSTFASDPEPEYRQGYEDCYYYFVAPLVLLVSYEFISLKRRG